MNAQNELYLYISAFIEELSSGGVRHVCACPGSRSTPLAVLLDQHPAMTLWMHLDERSCGFFALGMAMATGQPVGLLCTSGTAAANFFPAVIEALHARVPLILLTADRPPELQNVGANQTIDQVDLYGKQAKWFAQAPLPKASPEALRYVRTLGATATAMALADPQGPVHLNFPFREPLMPEPPSPDADRLLRQALREELEPLTVQGTEAAHATKPLAQVSTRLETGSLRNLSAELDRSERGIIICGPQRSSHFPSRLANLAHSLGFPILADPLSQVRCGPHDRSLIVDAYDALLRDKNVAESLRADVILRFGAMPRSKPLAEYLQAQPCRQILIAASPPAPDPVLSATDIFYVDPLTFCVDLNEATQSQPGPSSASDPTSWIESNRIARDAMSAYLASLDEMFEGKVFAELERLLPREALLFVGNSMPVRDLESFFPSSPRAIRFHANYGASGIDGATSAALGAASLREAPAFLVTGDLSFYHDLNALLAARLHELNLTIVVLNNDGGGIFSFLPQASHPSQFETLFGTPHGLDFRPTVEMFGGTYHRVAGWDDFRSLVGRPPSGLRVLEVRTERQRNVELHRQVWNSVASAFSATVAS